MLEMSITQLETSHDNSEEPTWDADEDPTEKIFTSLILEQVTNYFKTYHKLSGHHLNTAVDVFIMACFREEVSIKKILSNIQDCNILRLPEFISASSGNIYEFINENYIGVAKHLVNLTAGGNGGMATIGRGEWLIAILSGLGKANIIKQGTGDILYTDYNKREEVKWNGGKINVDDTPGRDINKKLYSILDSKNETQLTGNDKHFVPFRKKDKKKYTEEHIGLLNARYWQAITDEEKTLLSDSGLKILMLERAFNNVFDKSDTILIVEEDGQFVRFKKTNDALEYYTSKINKVCFECRAKQSNPVGIYMRVLA